MVGDSLEKLNRIVSENQFYSLLFLKITNCRPKLGQSGYENVALAQNANDFWPQYFFGKISAL